MKKIKDVAKIKNIDFTQPVQFDVGNLRFTTYKNVNNKVQKFPEGYVYDMLEVHYLFRGQNDEVLLPIIPFGVIECCENKSNIDENIFKYKFHLSNNSNINNTTLNSVEIVSKDLNAISEIIKLFDNKNFRQELINLGKVVR